MINMALSGDVLRLKLDLRCAVPRPNAHDLLWIAVDRSTTTTIKELWRLIRAKYGLTKKCELYFEDAWLSPQEPIQILGDKDIVRVVSIYKGPPDPASYDDDSVRPVQDESPAKKKKKRKQRASEGCAEDIVFMLDEEADTSLETIEPPQATQTFHKVHNDVSQGFNSAGNPVTLMYGIGVEDSTKKCEQHPKKKKREANVEVIEKVPETQAQEKRIILSSDSEEEEELTEVELEQDWEDALVTTSAQATKGKVEAVAQHRATNGGAWPEPAYSTDSLPFEDPPDEDAVKQPDAQKDFEESFEKAAPATKTEDDPPKCKDYSCYPRLKSPPRVGAIIAFKVLDLDYYYRTTVSDYKEGKVVHYNSVNGMMRIELRNVEANRSCSGMFGKEPEQDLPAMQKEVELLWTELCEPVMLS